MKLLCSFIRLNRVPLLIVILASAVWLIFHTAIP